MALNDAFLGIRQLFNPGQYTINPPAQPSLQPSIGQAPDDNSQPDNISQLTQVLLNRINQPDQNLDRLSSLYNDFPIHTKPGLLRSLAAGVIGMGYGPEEAQKFLNAPHNQEVGDWALRNKAAENIAELDIKGQQNQMSDAVRGIGALVANERTQNANDIALQRMQNEVEKTSNALKIAEDKIAANRDDRAAQEAYHNAALANQRAIADLRYEALRATTEARINASQSANSQKGWEFDQIDDENNPGKKILVRMNKLTGEIQPAKIGGAQVTGAEKLGGPPKATGAGSNTDATKVTNQTKALQEGAQLILPQIADIRKQAADLNARGMFGPVMSRVRDLGAKLGTVGDEKAVQKSFEDFNTAISSDPKLTQSGDSAVGQFSTALGLLASGAGRVHGGQRGGGSIQMINYMKNLLSSSSTLEMFNGRLKALENLMREYAAGPKATSGNQTDLDKAIDEILAGGKK